MGRHYPWADEEMLTAMDLHYNDGMRTQDVGTRLRRSKNQVIGMLNRIRKDDLKFNSDGNQDGTMPRKWWKRT